MCKILSSRYFQKGRNDIHVVQRGETLEMIAERHYGDQAYWRYIANNNRIRDPRRLSPGTILILPRIDSDDK